MLQISPFKYVSYSHSSFFLKSQKRISTIHSSSQELWLRPLTPKTCACFLNLDWYYIICPSKGYDKWEVFKISFLICFIFGVMCQLIIITFQISALKGRHLGYSLGVIGVITPGKLEGLNPFTLHFSIWFVILFSTILKHQHDINGAASREYLTVNYVVLEHTRIWYGWFYYIFRNVKQTQKKRKI